MHEMKVMCCECGTDMGVRSCRPENSDKISHGLCPECGLKALVEAQLAAEAYLKKKAYQLGKPFSERA